jgi:hypothetical protein
LEVSGYHVKSFSSQLPGWPLNEAIDGVSGEWVDLLRLGIADYEEYK